MIQSKIFLLAGHDYDGDGGAKNLKTGEDENDVATIVIQEIIAQAIEFYDIVVCPNTYNLNEQIAFLNKNATKDDFSLCLHLNSSLPRTEKGAFCFYKDGNNESKKYAKVIIDAYCSNIAIQNFGVKPDTKSNYKRLGIIRDVPCHSFLIELGSINNESEIVKKYGAEAILHSLFVLNKEAEKNNFSFSKKNMIFSDVSDKHHFAKAIQWAKDNKIAKGYEDGRLGVDEPLTVGRFLQFLKNYDDFKN